LRRVARRTRSIGRGWGRQAADGRVHAAVCVEGTWTWSVVCACACLCACGGLRAAAPRLRPTPPRAPPHHPPAALAAYPAARPPSHAGHSLSLLRHGPSRCPSRPGRAGGVPAGAASAPRRASSRTSGVGRRGALWGPAIDSTISRASVAGSRGHEARVVRLSCSHGRRRLLLHRVSILLLVAFLRALPASTCDCFLRPAHHYTLRAIASALPSYARVLRSLLSCFRRAAPSTTCCSPFRCCSSLLLV